jgi:bacterial/archaeal transporter family-2 protein
LITRFLPPAAAFVVGLLVALQARINGQLSSELQNGLQAAVVSFGSGFIVLTLLLVFMPRMRQGFPQLRQALREGTIRPWQIFGGILGGFFVAVQSATVPVLGVAVFTVAVVAGQSANSLFVDRVGLGPAGKQPITPARVVAAVLAVFAVGLAVFDRLVAASDIAPFAVAFALIAGVLIAVQQAINARVGRAAHSAWTAAWVNFVFGTAALILGLGIAVGIGWTQLSALPGHSWVIYTGGLIGVLFIATAAWVVRVIGVLLFAVLTIAGQLLGALILDIVAPTPGSLVTWNLLAGVLLALLAGVIASRKR